MVSSVLAVATNSTCERSKAHAEIVVHEGVVLGRIEHLEQCGRRIAPPVRADLVDLIEHEHRIARLRPPEPLDDAAGEGADVGAAVPADLRLVAHPAEGHAPEPPTQGAGDALTQTGLAHARRPDEAEYRLPRRTVARHAGWRGGHGRLASGLCRSAAALLAELLHREVLEDPILDLLEIEVILVEDLAGAVDVDGAAGELAPRQARHPLEIGDDHAVLGGGG